MTALTAPAASPAAPGALARVASVTRLHFANPATVLWNPILILAAIFLVNLAVWWIILSNIADPADRIEAAQGFQWSGASLFIFVYMMIVAVQAMNQTFSFAIGMSVTRRDYYLGSALAFVLLSIAFTLVLGVMGAIEEATGGWGLDGRMFTAVYFGGEGWLARMGIVFAYFLFFFFVGSASAAVYVRWKARGLTVFFVALSFAAVGAAALLTFTGTWPQLGAWFAEQQAPGLAAWSLLPTAVSAVAGFLLLRRATPRG